MAAGHAILWSTATACIYWTLAMQKKACKSAMFGRAWQACQRALSLHHSPAQHFARCQWQAGTAPSTPYLIYRWMVFIAVTSIGIASFACQRLPKRYRDLNFELNHMKWFIYFTNWGYMMIIVQSALALLVVHRYRADKAFNIPGEDEECTVPRRVRTPLLCRVYWLTHTVATDLAFVITLIYWTLVHDPKIHEINALNVLVHGGNSAVMLCEVAVTAHPVRAAHALYGAGAGLVYGLFSAIYWALGGTDGIGLPAIYPALDWSQPGSAFGFVALCAVVMMFSHALVTCLAALRVRLAARLYPRHQVERLTLPTH